MHVAACMDLHDVTCSSGCASCADGSVRAMLLEPCSVGQSCFMKHRGQRCRMTAMLGSRNSLWMCERLGKASSEN